jgi:hypothetical protein
MNRRVRQRINALNAGNIALIPILMAWTWTPASGRDPTVWWEPGIYHDVLGIDHYQNNEASLLTSVWHSVRAWAGARGLDVAVGEWGMRGTNTAAGQRVREWYESAAGSHMDGLGARVTALSAFDSSLNSPDGSWELQGAQLATFHELLADPRTARFSHSAFIGDFDSDQDVDMTDFGRFQACLSGVGIPHAGPGCSTCDFDADTDVDIDDLSRFMECFSGADMPADQNCSH